VCDRLHSLWPRPSRIHPRATIVPRIRNGGAARKNREVAHARVQGRPIPGAAAGMCRPA
jgi:hypothetical protein